MIEKKLSKVVNMKEEVKFSESVSKIHYPWYEESMQSMTLPPPLLHQFLAILLFGSLMQWHYSFEIPGNGSDIYQSRKEKRRGEKRREGERRDEERKEGERRGEERRVEKGREGERREEERKEEERKEGKKREEQEIKVNSRQLGGAGD